ncbi:APC family permease [Candidatus Mycoplasma pogonae]
MKFNISAAFSKNKKSNSSSKFTKRQFFLFGFNYVVGFGFIATIASVINLSYWGILVFALTALIALGSSLAFAQASHKYNNAFGGTYYYAKKTFGKEGSFFFGFNQIAQIPLFSAVSPLFLSKILESANPSIIANGSSMSEYQLNIMWQVLSVLIFIILISSVLFGLKTTKFLVFLSAFMKWITIFLGVIFAIIYAIQQNNISQNFSGESLSESFLSSPLSSFAIIVSTTISFIYAYGGYESLVTIAPDTKGTKMKRILMIMFGLIVGFYFLFYIIAMFLNLNSFKNNPNEKLELFLGLFRKTWNVAGIIIFSIGIFFNRVSGSISSVYSYNRYIVPMVEDRFFPSSLNTKNKNGEYSRITILVIFTIITSMILLNIIPRALNINDSFSAVLNSGTIAFLVQYFGTVLIVMIQNKRGEIQLKSYEKIIFVVAMVLIAFILLGYLFSPIMLLIEDAVNGKEVDYRKLWQGLLPILSYFVVIALGYGWRAIYNLINQKRNAALNNK